MGVDSTLDEHGHIESRRFDDGSVAGVIEGPSVGRLVYSRNGDPLSGYDRVFWYPDVPSALEALRAWDYPRPPTGYVRDLNRDPIDWSKEKG